MRPAYPNKSIHGAAVLSPWTMAVSPEHLPPTDYKCPANDKFTANDRFIRTLDLWTRSFRAISENWKRIGWEMIGAVMATFGVCTQQLDRHWHIGSIISVARVHAAQCRLLSISDSIRHAFNRRRKENHSESEHTNANNNNGIFANDKRPQTKLTSERFFILVVRCHRKFIQSLEAHTHAHSNSSCSSGSSSNRRTQTSCAIQRVKLRVEKRWLSPFSWSGSPKMPMKIGELLLLTASNSITISQLIKHTQFDAFAIWFSYFVFYFFRLVNLSLTQI